jgi:phosphonate transport system ATP-binding protein|tara:strand:+ start:318 stop:1073 length:756 start_codon:yes stop_codon:yes gene_type:complete
MQIEIKELRKTFDNGTRAIQGVDLTINEGEFVVILGASGSGKTTLLRSINGLVDCEKGEIKFDGNIVSSTTLPLLRKQTGMVFQDFNLVNNLSSINNVLTGLLDSSNTLMSMMYLFTKDQKKLALSCLEKVGLLDKAYDRVDQLSGGQKQRVGIARAIIKNPTLLLADEPVASLDPMISDSIMTLLWNIRHEIGLTVICNLHQVDLALKYSDRIIGLSGGRVVLDAPTKDVDEAYIRKIYDGHSAGLFFNS